MSPIRTYLRQSSFDDSKLERGTTISFPLISGTYLFCLSQDRANTPNGFEKVLNDSQHLGIFQED